MYVKDSSRQRNGCSNFVLISFLLHLPPGKRCAVPSAVDSVTFFEPPGRLMILFGSAIRSNLCEREEQNIRTVNEGMLVFISLRIGKFPIPKVLFASSAIRSLVLVPTSVYPFSVYEARTLYSGRPHFIEI